MIDDEDLGWTFDSVHSQTELFLDRGEKAMEGRRVRSLSKHRRSI